MSLLVDAEKSDCKVNDTAVTIGRVYVSFEGPQHPLGGYFDTLNHSTKSGSKGPKKNGLDFRFTYRSKTVVADIQLRHKDSLRKIRCRIS